MEEIKPLRALDAANSLRAVYVALGGIVPPPPKVPAYEARAEEAMAALKIVVDSGDILELRKLPAQVRQTICAMLVAFGRGAQVEPDAIIAYLPQDAGEEDRIRSALSWLLDQQTARLH